MADLRFTVPSIESFDSRTWDTAYITGIEGVPWLCNHHLESDQFNIGREIDESGKLNVVWPTQTLGNLCLSSTTLRVSEQSYSLPVELARGIVYQLRNQTEDWQRVGLKLPDSFFEISNQALEALLYALTSSKDSDEQFRSAQSAINLALKGAVGLCDQFSHQALEARLNNEGRLATLLGCQLAPNCSLQSMGDALKTAFNLINVPADFGTVAGTTQGSQYGAFDAQIEWAQQTQHKLCVGPLVDFRDGRLPSWMVLLEEGFESLLQTACQHVQDTVQRYRGKVHLWNCATGLNVPNRFGWTDDEVLRMAVSLIETVRKNDERCPVLLTIDQPWSEYLRKAPNGISPLHFADALIRADLGLSGLALELNFDTWPGGSFLRDPIEINRLIDRWSMLGLPLMVILSSPTDNGNTSSTNRVSTWKSQYSNGPLGAETIVRLLLSKPSVHAVIWNSVADESEERFVGTGLWSKSGKAKPILGSIAKLRKTCLH